MDFKSTCVLISFLALAGGIVKGWSDAENNKGQPGDKVGGNAPAKTPGPSPGDDFPDPGDEPGVEEPRPGVSRPISPSELKPIDLTVSSLDESKLEEITDLIGSHKLPQAARSAREMVQDSSGITREKARQLEARIKLLQAMEPSEAGKAPALKEVVQANSNTHICTSVEESFDSYKLKLISGGVTTLRKQDVRKVQDIAPSASRRILLTRLGKRIDSLKDPLDFYLRGGRKYYRLGLVDEGYGLLTELLEREDADLALSVLGESEAEELLPYWYLASGSGIAAIERKAELRAEEIAATPPAHLVAGSESPGQPEPVVASKPPRPPRRPPPRRPVRQPTAADNSAMQKVGRLISKANTYYINARRDEKKRGDFKKAYETLRSAQDLLGRMPATDEVRKTRARVATQMLDVSKSLGFFDF